MEEKMSKENFEKELGKRLKYFRQNAKLTQSQMGKECSISPNHISAIERGCYMCSAKTLVDYAHTLNMSLDELVGLTKNHSVLPELLMELSTVHPHDQKRLLNDIRQSAQIVPELQETLQGMDKTSQKRLYHDIQQNTQILPELQNILQDLDISSQKKLLQILQILFSK